MSLCHDYDYYYISHDSSYDLHMTLLDFSMSQIQIIKKSTRNGTGFIGVTYDIYDTYIRGQRTHK